MNCCKAVSWNRQGPGQGSGSSRRSKPRRASASQVEICTARTDVSWRPSRSTTHVWWCAPRGTNGSWPDGRWRKHSARNACFGTTSARFRWWPGRFSPMFRRGNTVDLQGVETEARHFRISNGPSACRISSRCVPKSPATAGDSPTPNCLMEAFGFTVRHSTVRQPRSHGCSGSASKPASKRTRWKRSLKSTTIWRSSWPSPSALYAT